MGNASLLIAAAWVIGRVQAVHHADGAQARPFETTSHREAVQVLLAADMLIQRDDAPYGVWATDRGRAWSYIATRELGECFTADASAGSEHAERLGWIAPARVGAKAKPGFRVLVDPATLI